MPCWTSYRQTIGDRSGLFAALRARWHPTTALYPGSYLDLSPSTSVDSVTYVDPDRRAARFFADKTLLAKELAGRTSPGAATVIDFLDKDYTRPLPLAAGSFDLLVSLYAGPVLDHCRSYLSPRGLFLANTSHGDASLAALDPSLRLVGVILHRDGRYSLRTDNLDRYVIPKRPTAADPDEIRRRGRGIAYTVTAFAYVFTPAAE